MKSIAIDRETATAIAKSWAAPRPWAIGVSVLVQILIVLSLQFLPRIGGERRPSRVLPVDLVFTDETPASVAPGDPAPVAVKNETPAARAVAVERAPPPVGDGARPEPAEWAKRAERLREGLRRWLCIDLESNPGDRDADCPSGRGLTLEPAWDGDGVWTGGDLATLLGGDAVGLRLEIAGQRKGYLPRAKSLRLPDPRALDPNVAWDLATQMLGPLPLPVHKPPPRPTID